ncbi:hypothetical protein C8R44DRAFT_749741 [Mycena epipterygia]|nr:hypothetical protein C8R44DRAFT_749741 [Mycena epipterygia]
MFWFGNVNNITQRHGVKADKFNRDSILFAESQTKENGYEQKHGSIGSCHRVRIEDKGSSCTSDPQSQTRKKKIKLQSKFKGKKEPEESSREHARKFARDVWYERFVSLWLGSKMPERENNLAQLSSREVIAGRGRSRRRLQVVSEKDETPELVGEQRECKGESREFLQVPSSLWMIEDKWNYGIVRVADNPQVPEVLWRRDWWRNGIVAGGSGEGKTLERWETKDVEEARISGCMARDGEMRLEEQQREYWVGCASDIERKSQRWLEVTNAVAVNEHAGRLASGTSSIMASMSSWGKSGIVVLVKEKF